jgi:hypothetical protein
MLDHAKRMLSKAVLPDMLSKLRAAAGKLGGAASSSKLSPEQRQQRARDAAAKRWARKHGNQQPEQREELPEPEQAVQNEQAAPEPVQSYTGEVAAKAPEPAQPEQQPQYFAPLGPEEPGWLPPLLTASRKAKIDRRDARLRGGLGWAEPY